MKGPILILVGGVGGSKLVWGLCQVLSKTDLSIVVNTGDDEKFYGLHVSPDLDTVMYTLGDIANTITGWGIQDDTNQAIKMLEKYGEQTWFTLGDKDLGTHIRRTNLLNRGLTLSEVTKELCKSLGVDQNIMPMTNDPVQTRIVTDEGEFPFQEYFVEKRCLPRVLSVKFDGASTATVSPGFDRALNEAGAIVFAPSNPMLSIDPILSLPTVKERISRFSGPKIAVSPIVAGKAIKGPAAKILEEMGKEVNCVSVAKHYQNLCNIFVLDQTDEHLCQEIVDLGFRAETTNTIMTQPADKVALAKTTVKLIEGQ